MKSFRHLSALVDQMAISGGNFLTLLLCARLLPSDEMGKIGFIFAAYMATVLLNVSLIFQNASSHASRYQRSCTYQLALRRLQLGSSVAVSALICAIFYAFPALTGWQASLVEITWVAAFLLSQQLADYYRREKHLLNEPHYAAVMSTLLVSTRLLLLILVPMAGAGDTTVLLTLSAAPAALLVLFHHYRGSAPGLARTRRIIRWHLDGARFLLAAAPVGWLWSYLPLFMLGQVKGLAAVGAFTAARSLANAFNIFLELLETRIAALAGMAYARSPDQLTPFLFKAGMLGLGVLSVLGGGIYLFRHDLVAIAYASRYPELGEPLAILVLAQLLTLGFRLSAIRFRTIQLQHAVFWGYVAGAIAVAVSAYWLIERQGIEGAAWSIVIGAIAISVGQNLAARYKRP